MGDGCLLDVAGGWDYAMIIMRAILRAIHKIYAWSAGRTKTLICSKFVQY